MSTLQNTKSWIAEGIGGFDDVKWNEHAPLPAITDHDVLVKFHAAAPNHRDLIIRKASQRTQYHARYPSLYIVDHLLQQPNSAQHKR
jgi:NADPH:quinone reductase-like Zn-dependent oxidoreductase